MSHNLINGRFGSKEALRYAERADQPRTSDRNAQSTVGSRIRGPLISQFAGALTKSNDVQASNVPGLRGTAYLAGAKIERAYGFGPLPGCATMVTLVSHGETCCIAVNLDPAAVTEPELSAKAPS